MYIDINVTFESDMIVDVILNADRSYSPWVHSIEQSGEHSFSIIFDDPDGEEGNADGNVEIGLKEIEKGLKRMAVDQGNHLGAILSGNYDVITSDVLLQCILFGELVYS